MKQMLKGLSDKASDYLDTKNLANPVEVINEELGGETREESKERRNKAKEAKPPEPVKKNKGGAISSAIKDKIVDAVTTRNALVPKALIPAKDMYDAKQLSEPVKKAKGGKVSSASKRADGIAIRGKTRA